MKNLPNNINKDLIRQENVLRKHIKYNNNLNEISDNIAKKICKNKNELLN